MDPVHSKAQEHSMMEPVHNRLEREHSKRALVHNRLGPVHNMDPDSMARSSSFS